MLDRNRTDFVRKAGVAAASQQDLVLNLVLADSQIPFEPQLAQRWRNGRREQEVVLLKRLPEVLSSLLYVDEDRNLYRNTSVSLRGRERTPALRQIPEFEHEKVFQDRGAVEAFLKELAGLA
jgi:hypothetical protein